MLRFYFWVLKGPQLHPRDLPFWRYKAWKFQLSHLFPKNWAARSPPYFAQSIIGMTPKTLKVSWQSREQLPRYSGFYSPTLSPIYKKRLLERSHYRYSSTLLINRAVLNRGSLLFGRIWMEYEQTSYFELWSNVIVIRRFLTLISLY